MMIATPDHWHVRIKNWAYPPGKDVYVEEPISHNLWDGRKMVEATHQYNRIVVVAGLHVDVH